jgi:hypothetical protein
MGMTAHSQQVAGTSAQSAADAIDAGPRFTVMVVEPNTGPGRPSFLHVQASATGQTLATVQPRAGTSWSAVASTGDSQAFVLAANPLHGPHAGWTCSSTLYRLQLTASGQVGSLTPLDAPAVNGGIFAGGLRASADGQTIAYAASMCPQTAAGQEAIGVIGTATGRATQWTMPARWFMGGSISLAADGSLVGLGVPNGGDAASHFRPSGPEPGVWVLRASSAPGTVTQRGREAVRIPRSTPLGPVALSADGTQVYVNTRVQLSARQGADDLAAYSVATGARLRMVRAGWKALVQEMSADPDATRALFWGVYSSPAAMDLATGKLTMLSAHLPRHALVDDAAW